MTKRFCFAFLILLALFSCKQAPGTAPDAGPAKIPEDRKTVSRKPVSSYREKLNNTINDWYFAAELYETPKTFSYLLKMEYEEVRGEDTIHIPDFGLEPRPEIRKGSEKYSCIIGFLDRENVFREYKKVMVIDGRELKLITLNHYSVVSEPAR